MPTGFQGLSQPAREKYHVGLKGFGWFRLQLRHSKPTVPLGQAVQCATGWEHQFS